MIMKNKHYKVFSKQVAEKLMGAGFEPIATEKNYKRPGFLVWHFEITDEFMTVLDKTLNDKGAQDE